MISFRRSIFSLLLVVAFLVLASLATLIYGGNEQQKEQIKDNNFYQKAQAAFQAIFLVSEKFADTNLDKNLGFGQKIKDELKTVDLNNLSLTEKDGNPTETSVDSSDEAGFWASLWSRLKTEWHNSQSEDNQAESSAETTAGSKTDSNSALVWEKTADGAEIIFKSETGQEYKLLLPFKFLSK